MDVVKQLCIKGCVFQSKGKQPFAIVQGQTYTTSIPKDDNSMVHVFSSYWVHVPKENFVPIEV